MFFGHIFGKHNRNKSPEQAPAPEPQAKKETISFTGRTPSSQSVEDAYLAANARDIGATTPAPEALDPTLQKAAQAAGRIVVNEGFSIRTDLEDPNTHYLHWNGPVQVTTNQHGHLVRDHTKPQ